MTSFVEYVEVCKVLAPSLVAAAGVGVAAAVVGVFVLLRREALLAITMPHTVAVGVAISLRLGWPTLPPAVGSVGLTVAMLAWSKRHGANHWLLPALYVASICLSFLIIANSGQHVSEMQAIFTGIDVAVTASQAWLSTPIVLLTAGVVAIFWRRWLLLAQAPSTAEAAGMSPPIWDASFLSLLAVVLLFGTNDLGVVMVLAMLFLPAASVLPWARRVPSALVAAVVVAILFLIGGLVLSIENNLPLSQSVGGVGFVAMLGSHTLAKLVER